MHCRDGTYFKDNPSTRGASIGHRWGVKWLQEAIHHRRRLPLATLSYAHICQVTKKRRGEEEEEAPNIFCQQDCAYLQPSNNLLRRVGPVFAAKVPLNLRPQSQTSGKAQRNNVYFRSAPALFSTMLSAHQQPVYLTHLPMKHASGSQKRRRGNSREAHRVSWRSSPLKTRHLIQAANHNNCKFFTNERHQVQCLLWSDQTSIALAFIYFYFPRKRKF